MEQYRETSMDVGRMYLVDIEETKCIENLRVSVRMILERILVMGDTELELTIFCNQISLPAVELEYPPRHKTFNSQFVLPEIHVGVMVEVVNQ